LSHEHHLFRKVNQTTDAEKTRQTADGATSSWGSVHDALTHHGLSPLRVLEALLVIPMAG